MRFLALWFLVFITACTALPEPIPASIPVQKQLYTHSQVRCLDLLTDFKRTVQAQGVQDAQLVWDPRFPHLAFDRFSLAMLPELSARADQQQWLNYVAHQAMTQRQTEYLNLPRKAGYQAQALELCAAQLVHRSLGNPAFWSELMGNPPEFPSDYVIWQRVLGVYPVSQFVARPSIDNEKRRLISHFIQPVDGYAIRYAMHDKPSLTQSQIRQWFQQAGRQSALAWPVLTEAQQQRLLQYYAPVFQVETRSRDDFPGQVKFVTTSQPTLITRKPTVYTHVSYTRFYGQTLMQLNYSLWFANRTARSSFDPYAGPFDGVLIRLTLDPVGQPLILDSIHHCGCYHMVFALSPKLEFASLDNAVEWPILQKIYPGKATEHLEVTLTHGEHMIKDVHWLSSDEPAARSLTVLAYQQLQSLPTPENHHQSLFDQQGMLVESVRAERFYLWPFGIQSPGTQRQIGHHATAFIGQRHFDAPFLFETLFQKP
ncbi:hypothetical protein [Photobacterium galatheae]|uniref:Lipoprotein n=1 Tax=Photobacterium galatheae TaxID=1654360 RepID=A0A066RS89_9GAMM|nr:hypothetical protein [Photobacterium galatheae]KDM90253.1 hypothetical protein EA58_18235 [Photobacterium galatheae]MCM0151485.1 hypothetical protein [Photobacterium galatheae]